MKKFNIKDYITLEQINQKLTKNFYNIHQLEINEKLLKEDILIKKKYYYKINILFKIFKNLKYPLIISNHKNIENKNILISKINNIFILKNKNKFNIDTLLILNKFKKILLSVNTTCLLLFSNIK